MQDGDLSEHREVKTMIAGATVTVPVPVALATVGAGGGGASDLKSCRRSLGMVVLLCNVELVGTVQFLGPQSGGRLGVIEQGNFFFLVPFVLRNLDRTEVCSGQKEKQGIPRCKQ